MLMLSASWKPDYRKHTFPTMAFGNLILRHPFHTENTLNAFCVLDVVTLKDISKINNMEKWNKIRAN